MEGNHCQQKIVRAAWRPGSALQTVMLFMVNGEIRSTMKEDGRLRATDYRKNPDA